MDSHQRCKPNVDITSVTMQKTTGGEAHMTIFCHLELLTLLQNATKLGQKVLGPKLSHREQR